MSHMHMPDGVLPIWLILLGWVATGLVLVLLSLRLRKGEQGRQLPLLGVMAAVMLVGMSTEIVPIAYHTNLSVLAGIVLGPSLAFLAAFIVNLILAMIGHGGITVVGLNALVIGTEAVLGYYLFTVFRSLLRGRRSPALAAGIATFVALLLSTLLMVGVVGVSSLDPSARAAVDTEELTFRNPLEHGLIVAEVGAGQEVHGASSQADEAFDLLTFARLVLLLGLLGWVGEAALTGAIVGFVFRVRPDLIGGAATRSMVSRPSVRTDTPPPGRQVGR